MNILLQKGVDAWREFRDQQPKKEIIDLKGAVFVDLNIDSIYFFKCDLSNSKFINCKMENAFFNESILTGASFTNCDLKFSYISGCEFKNVTIYNSTFQFGIFEKSNIENCGAINSDFSQTSWDEANIMKVNFDKKCLTIDAALDINVLEEILREKNFKGLKDNKKIKIRKKRNARPKSDDRAIH